MSHWLYAIRPVRDGFLEAPTDDEKDAMAAHYGYLKDAADSGRVLLAGPATDGRFPGIVVLRAADEGEAGTFMEHDPSVERGVMSAELHPFRASLVRGPRARNDVTEGLGYDGGLHCDLRVSDLDRSLVFYTDVLGFEVIHHYPENGWAELSTPVAAVKIGLSQVEELPPPGGGAVPTFGVTDLAAARARLEERGDVRFDGDTCEIEGFVRLATLYDPDGNAIMLYEDLAGASSLHGSASS